MTYENLLGYGWRMRLNLEIGVVEGKGGIQTRSRRNHLHGTQLEFRLDYFPERRRNGTTPKAQPTG
jgi:hypothetical protein